MLVGARVDGAREYSGRGWTERGVLGLRQASLGTYGGPDRQAAPPTRNSWPGHNAPPRPFRCKLRAGRCSLGGGIFRREERNQDTHCVPATVTVGERIPLFGGGHALSAPLHFGAMTMGYKMRIPYNSRLCPKPFVDNPGLQIELFRLIRLAQSWLEDSG